MASRQSTFPRMAARWNLQQDQGLSNSHPRPLALSPALRPRCPGVVGQHLRGFALRVQLGGDQALADEERCHPPGIIVVHSLQELLIALGPVLTLQ